MISEPWRRVDAIPIPYTADLRGYLADLPEGDFEALVHANLLPRDSSPAGQKAWRHLWSVITADLDLNDQVTDLLEEWIEASEAHDSAGDPKLAKRIAKFVHVCSNTLERQNHPLSWAMPRARVYNTAGRRVIETLVDAISDHRAATRQPSTYDRELWQALADVALDPDDSSNLEQLAAQSLREASAIAARTQSIADDDVLIILPNVNGPATAVVSHLATAIATHRDQIEEPTADDLELWHVLEELHIRIDLA